MDEYLIDGWKVSESLCTNPALVKTRHLTGVCEKLVITTVQIHIATNVNGAPYSCVVVKPHDICLTIFFTYFHRPQRIELCCFVLF